MAKDLLLAVSILSILSTALSQYDCTEENLYKTKAKPGDVTSYYICLSLNGKPSSIQCPEDLVFNAGIKGCSYKYDSPPETCPSDGHVIPEHDWTCSKYKVCQNTGTEQSVQLELKLLTCNNSAPIFDPFVGKCVKESDYFICGFTTPDCDNPVYEDKLLAAPGDCQSFYVCNDGVRVKERCDSGKVFDAFEYCIDKSKSACRSGPLVQDICKDKELQNVPDPNYCKGYYYCYDRVTPYWKFCGDNRYYSDGSCWLSRPANCNCEGLKLPAKGKLYVAVSSDKNKYVVCEKGKAPVEKTCPMGYLFDAKQEACVRGY